MLPEIHQVDAIDLNRNTATSADLMTSAIGLVLSPSDHYLVKFEYDFVKERHGAVVRNNKLWFGLVAEF